MDPYKILGVGYSATDEEIKRAYRNLSRKYHPDANVGKPEQKEYEEKFKEVQQAYQMIMDQKQGKEQSRGFENGQGGFYGDFWGSRANPFGFDYRPQEESKDEQYYRAALKYIQNGYYTEGLNVLDKIEERSAQWYYYSSISNYKIGNNAIALEHAKIAYALEPDNFYYAQLLSQLQVGENRYQQRSTHYGGNPTVQTGNYCGPICSTFILANLCCSGSYFGLPIICCI